MAEAAEDSLEVVFHGIFMRCVQRGLRGEKETNGVGEDGLDLNMNIGRAGEEVLDSFIGVVGMVGLAAAPISLGLAVPIGAVVASVGTQVYTCYKFISAQRAGKDIDNPLNKEKALRRLERMFAEIGQRLLVRYHQFIRTMLNQNGHIIVASYCALSLMKEWIAQNDVFRAELEKYNSEEQKKLREEAEKAAASGGTQGAGRLAQFFRGKSTAPMEWDDVLAKQPTVDSLLQSLMEHRMFTKKSLPKSCLKLKSEAVGPRTVLGGSQFLLREIFCRPRVAEGHLDVSLFEYRAHHATPGKQQSDCLQWTARRSKSESNSLTTQASTLDKYCYVCFSALDQGSPSCEYYKVLRGVSLQTGDPGVDVLATADEARDFLEIEAREMLIEIPATPGIIELYLADKKNPDDRTFRSHSLIKWLQFKLNHAFIMVCCHDNALQGLDLSGGDFSGVNFRRADLRGCCMHNTKWISACLTGSIWGLVEEVNPQAGSGKPTSGVPPRDVRPNHPKISLIEGKYSDALRNVTITSCDVDWSHWIGIDMRLIKSGSFAGNNFTDSRFSACAVSFSGFNCNFEGVLVEADEEIDDEDLISKPPEIPVATPSTDTPVPASAAIVNAGDANTSDEAPMAEVCSNSINDDTEGAAAVASAVANAVAVRKPLPDISLEGLGAEDAEELVEFKEEIGDPTGLLAEQMSRAVDQDQKVRQCMSDVNEKLDAIEGNTKEILGMLKEVRELLFSPLSPTSAADSVKQPAKTPKQMQMERLSEKQLLWTQQQIGQLGSQKFPGRAGTVVVESDIIVSGAEASSANLGGSGKFYKGISRRNSKLSKAKVAIKMIPNIASMSAAQLTRFHRDGDFLSKISHANIAKLYAADPFSMIPRMCLDWLPFTLRAYCLDKHSKINIEKVFRLMDQISDAVCHLHTVHKIAHRNLNPNTIRLCSAGRGSMQVKLTEFGYAKAEEILNEQSWQHCAADSLCSSSTIETVMSEKYVHPPVLVENITTISALPYLAPEMLSEGEEGEGDIEFSYKVDIYALCTIFNELITKRDPFPDADIGGTRSLSASAVAAASASAFATATTSASASASADESMGESRVAALAARVGPPSFERPRRCTAEDLENNLSWKWVNKCTAPLVAKKNILNMLEDLIESLFGLGKGDEGDNGNLVSDPGSIAFSGWDFEPERRPNSTQVHWWVVHANRFINSICAEFASASTSSKKELKLSDSSAAITEVQPEASVYYFCEFVCKEESWCMDRFFGRVVNAVELERIPDEESYSTICRHLWRRTPPITDDEAAYSFVDEDLPNLRDSVAVPPQPKNVTNKPFLVIYKPLQKVSPQGAPQSADSAAAAVDEARKDGWDLVEEDDEEKDEDDDFFFFHYGNCEIVVSIKQFCLDNAVDWRDSCGDKAEDCIKSHEVVDEDTGEVLFLLFGTARKVSADPAEMKSFEHAWRNNFCDLSNLSAVGDDEGSRCDSGGSMIRGISDMPRGVSDDGSNNIMNSATSSKNDFTISSDADSSLAVNAAKVAFGKEEGMKRDKVDAPIVDPKLSPPAEEEDDDDPAPPSVQPRHRPPSLLGPRRQGSLRLNNIHDSDDDNRSPSGSARPSLGGNEPPSAEVSADVAAALAAGIDPSAAVALAGLPASRGGSMRNRRGNLVRQGAAILPSSIVLAKDRSSGNSAESSDGGRNRGNSFADAPVTYNQDSNCGTDSSEAPVAHGAMGSVSRPGRPMLPRQASARLAHLNCASVDVTASRGNQRVESGHGLGRGRGTTSTVSSRLAQRGGADAAMAFRHRLGLGAGNSGGAAALPSSYAASLYAAGVNASKGEPRPPPAARVKPAPLVMSDACALWCATKLANAFGKEFKTYSLMQIMLGCCTNEEDVRQFLHDVFSADAFSSAEVQHVDKAGDSDNKSGAFDVLSFGDRIIEDIFKHMHQPSAHPVGAASLYMQAAAVDSAAVPSGNGKEDCDLAPLVLIYKELHSPTLDSHWGDKWSPLKYWKGVQVVEGDELRVGSLEFKGVSLPAPASFPLSTLALRHMTSLSMCAIDSLEGPLPEALGSLTSLTKLEIASNKGVTGGLPERWSNLASLVSLTIRDCESISGTLPLSWGSLRQLECLDLSDTGISGALPDEYGQLAALLSLNLSGTKVEGLVPDSWAGMVKLSKISVPVTVTGTNKFPKTGASAIQFLLNSNRNPKDKKNLVGKFNVKVA